MNNFLLPLTLIFLCGAFSGSSLAEDSTYQGQILLLQDQFIRLDLEKHDMADSKRALAPEKEAERHRLMGALLELDPMNVLMKQLEDEILALISLDELTESDLALLEQRKQYLAMTASLTSQCETLEEAQTLAKQVRICILRGDMKGLQALAK